ncbi:MAG: nickel-dependent lactate racemase [Bacillaceae bacterium]|nr:nickel-dependent lactate racemase [Bacillaceae bacterium]
MKISLPYGDLTLQADLNLSDTEEGHVKTIRPIVPPVEQETEIMKRALEQPIQSLPLRELARNKQKAVILVSDLTRLAPTHRFLPLIVDELKAGGLDEEQMTVVVALGLHRHMTEEEMTRLVGEDMKKRVRCLNHSALPEDCQYVGTTSRGTPVDIFRPVAEADLRIATGNIEPHKMAGFSGGIKALVPGTASERTIKKNHALSVDNRAKPAHLSDNPVRLDLEEAAEMVPVQFLFNVIVDPSRRILDAVAGHPIASHRRGASRAYEIFMHKLPEPCDLVVASAGGAPKDLNLYQAVKSLYNARQALRPGGIIVFCARCQEGYGNGEFQRWMENITDPDKIRKNFAEQFVLGGHKAHDLTGITTDAQVFMITDMPDPIVKLMGMVPFSTLQEAMDNALKQLAQPNILVMPYASLSFVQTGVKV